MEAAPTGTRNIDANSRKGERYSIKTVTHPTTKKTGTFHGLNPPDSSVEDTRQFEYVTIVKIDDELEPFQILELDWPLFLKHKKWDKSQKGRFSPIDNNQFLIATTPYDFGKKIGKLWQKRLQKWIK